MAEMKFNIDGFGLIEHMSPVLKELWADDRIGEDVKREYKTKLLFAVNEWAGKEKSVN